MADITPTREMVANRVTEVQEVATNALEELNNFISAMKSAMTIQNVPYMDSVQMNTYTPTPINIDAAQPASPMGYIDQAIGTIDPYQPDISEAVDSLSSYEGKVDTAISELVPYSSDVTIDNVEVGDVTIPTLSATPPQINPVTEPTPFREDAPEAPEITDPSVPQPPDLRGMIPDIPELPEITLPQPYIPNTHTFAPINPTIGLDLTPPDLKFEPWSEEVYTSTLKDAVKAKLLSDVQNGSTGLGATVLSDIWNLRSEMDAINEFEQIETAMETWSSRQLNLPDGALFGAIDEITEKRALGRTDRSRDISHKEADLAQTNTHFILDKSIVFEQMELQHFNNVTERALRAAIAVVEMGKVAYQVKIDYFNTQLAQYQLGAQVLEANLRGELINLEAKKNEIENAKLTVEMRNQILARVKMEAELVTLYVEIYKREVEVARLQADVERNKIDIFGKKVEAFSALVTAKTAEYGLYREKQGGEKTKVELFSEQVRAYSSEVDGAKAKAGLEEAKANAKAAVNRAKVEKIQAEIAAFKANADIIVEKIKATIDMFKSKAGLEVEKTQAETAAFKANSDIIVEKIKTYSDMYKTDGSIYAATIGKGEGEARLQVESARIAEQANAANLQMKLQASIQNLQAFIRVAEVEIEAGKDGARVLAALVSAALQAINASMSISAGFTESHSNSVGYDYKGSYPTTTALPAVKSSTP